MSTYKETERLAVWEREMKANELIDAQREAARRIESGEEAEVDIEWF